MKNKQRKNQPKNTPPDVTHYHIHVHQVAEPTDTNKLILLKVNRETAVSAFMFFHERIMDASVSDYALGKLLDSQFEYKGSKRMKASKTEISKIRNGENNIERINDNLRKLFENPHIKLKDIGE